MNNLINKAIKHLIIDKKLKLLIDKNKKPFFEEDNNYYHALSKSIISTIKRKSCKNNL